MEECEVLCNRLAIMVDGKIVCVGGAQELKQRFGADYIVRVQLDAEKSENQVAGIKEDARKLMDCEVADENMVRIFCQFTSWISYVLVFIAGLHDVPGKARRDFLEENARRDERLERQV